MAKSLVDTYNVMTPVTLEDGRTTWLKVGVAYAPPSGKYLAKATIHAIPLSALGGQRLELYLYPYEKEETK